jgi:hypothetical protein
MKHVAVEALMSAVPLGMTKREKLLRWADLVAKAHHTLILYHELEYMPRSRLSSTVVHEGTAFAVAAADGEFQAAGLSPHPTISQAMDFFELTQHEVHAFSCDCGGHIGNTQQADRIRQLAR